MTIQSFEERSGLEFLYDAVDECVFEAKFPPGKLYHIIKNVTDGVLGRSADSEVEIIPSTTDYVEHSVMEFPKTPAEEAREFNLAGISRKCFLLRCTYASTKA